MSDAQQAMQRFWLTDPAVDAWQAVSVARIPFQDRVGYWLGSALLLAACSKIEPEAR